LQQIAAAQQTRGFDIFAFGWSLLQKILVGELSLMPQPGILQPLIGIAFVVLYLDSKYELPSHVEPIVRAGEGDAVS
jgi:hypothetical protein